jgi:DNA polymerase V
MPTSFEFENAFPESFGDGAPPRSNTSSSNQEGDHQLVAGAVFKAQKGEATSRPLYLCRVEAGFPSPADDYVETTLDLNEVLVGDETSTFFVRVAGTSMTDIGIHDGDTIIVDRSIEPSDGDVVVAALDGELTVKRYEVRSGRPLLIPESATHDPIPVEPGQSFVVWGVVTKAIHDIS